MCDICVFLEFLATMICNLLSTFRDNLSVPSSRSSSTRGLLHTWRWDQKFVPKRR